MAPKIHCSNENKSKKRILGEYVNISNSQGPMKKGKGMVLTDDNMETSLSSLRQVL